MVDLTKFEVFEKYFKLKVHSFIEVCFLFKSSSKQKVFLGICGIFISFYSQFIVFIPFPKVSICKIL